MYFYVLLRNSDSPYWLCSWTVSFVETASTDFKSGHYEKETRAKSCCTGMLPVVSECQQVLWLRWQESDACLCSQSNLHLPPLRTFKSLKLAVFLCWQSDTSSKDNRINNIYHVERNHLPPWLWSFSSSSETKSQRWEGRDAWVTAER